MNGKDLMTAMTFIDSRFLEELEAEPVRAKPRHVLPRKVLLVAAILVLMLALVGCGTVVYRLVLAQEPWASMPRVEAKDVPREDFQLTVAGVSPTSISIKCDVAGFGVEEASICFLQNGAYTIERKTENGWEALPRKLEDPAQPATQAITDGHHTAGIMWTAIYGYLDPGTYRITTALVEGHEPFTVEFAITGDMCTESLEIAEELSNREYWYVRETGSSQYGPLDNVPEEYREQYTRPPEVTDWATEYWKYGDDYLYLYYEDGEITIGMMYKDGVKYSLEREWESNDAPVVGWMPWPDLDLNRLSGWISYVRDEGYSQEPTHREDGSLEKLVLTKTENDGSSFDVDITYTTVLEFPDTSPEDIAKRIADQNTDVWQAFSWEEEQEKYKAQDVAFVNTQPQPITTASEALALADRECTVEATKIKIYRDADAGIWKVEYQIFYGHQGYQFIYLNDDGITVMVSGAGSKEEAWMDGHPAP